MFTHLADGTREETWGDWFARLDAEKAERGRNGWGTPEARWTFDPKRLTLTPSVEPWYVIDLQRFTSSAELLDTVFQLHAKAWVTPDLHHAFLAAVRDLLDPQRHLCSWGAERGPIDVAATVEATLSGERG